MTQILEHSSITESITEQGPCDSMVVPKEEEWTRRVSSVAPGRPSERIVVVSDDPTALARPCSALSRDGYELSFASPTSLTEIIGPLAPDLLLIDMTTSPQEAIALCRNLRDGGSNNELTIVLLAKRGADEDADEEMFAAALIAGADECIVLGRRMTELRARIRVQLRNKSYRDTLARIRGERDNFREEASLDALTNLPNRKQLFAVLRASIERGQPFALLFLDLDHFKRINDELGHGTGDEVLRAAAACLKQHSRTGDCCGRFGGEEFVLVLAGANGTEALRAANRHRAALERIRFQYGDRAFSITASVGVAVYDPQSPCSLEDLLATADAGLYEAKRRGRNLALVAEPTPPAVRAIGAAG